MNKQLSVVFAYFFTCNIALAQQSVSPDELPSYIAACAADAGIEVDSNFSGSLNSIFSDGERVDGDVSIEATSSLNKFLELFPEDQRITAYSIYQECLRDLTVSALSPEQQKYRNDVLFACEPVSSIQTTVVYDNLHKFSDVNEQALRDQIESVSGIANSPLTAFGKLLIGESGTIYREATSGELVVMRQKSGEERSQAERRARLADYQSRPMIVIDSFHKTVTARSSSGRTPVSINVAIHVDFQLAFQLSAIIAILGGDVVDGEYPRVELEAELANCGQA